MNDLQCVEFSLLKEFDRVCGLLGLRYFLVCGSALGSVKYQGFIPWDDDIDVALFRKDYERFLKEAPGMLREGVFLQNYKSDPAFPQIYSKLRDSGTTYIESSAKNLPINHGIFIDVFPLDGYPSGWIAQGKLEFFKRVYQSILLSAYDVPRKNKSKMLVWVYGKLGLKKRTAWVAKNYEKLVSRYSISRSGLVCNHGNWQGRLEYAAAWQYGCGAEAVFEGLKVFVPERYDEYLTQKYGDWRSDPPKEERIGHHFYEILDCAKSFDE